MGVITILIYYSLGQICDLSTCTELVYYLLGCIIFP